MAVLICLCNASDVSSVRKSHFFYDIAKKTNSYNFIEQPVWSAI